MSLHDVHHVLIAVRLRGHLLFLVSVMMATEKQWQATVTQTARTLGWMDVSHSRQPPQRAWVP